MREVRIKYRLLLSFLIPLISTFFIVLGFSKELAVNDERAYALFSIVAASLGLLATMLPFYYKVTGKVTWPEKGYSEISFHEKQRLFKSLQISIVFLGYMIGLMAAFLFIDFFLIEPQTPRIHGLIPIDAPNK